MEGSIARKMGRLVMNLAAYPRHLPRYIRDNTRHWLANATPLDLEIPWFSYAATDMLESFLEPHMKAFEYGSGGSTIFLAKRVKAVLSVEDNSVWFDIVSRRLHETGLSNVELLLRPFDVKNPVGFESSEYFGALPDEMFDVLVIDGSEEWTQVRPACFRRAEERVNPGGIIVLDDSWRYHEPQRSNKARRVESFVSTGPCRPGVTSTDIFFY